MLKRAIFGAIYVAVIVLCILGGSLSLLVMMLLLSTLAVNEFLTMTVVSGEREERGTVWPVLAALDCVGAAVIVITAWTGTFFLPGAVTYLLYVVMRLCTQLFVNSDRPLRQMALSMMSQLYIGLPIALMSVVFRISPHLLLLLFVLVWANDTFAYLSGITFGRHKLCESISPKKTWEGFWGGTLCTAAFGLGAAFIFRGAFGALTPGAIGVLAVIVSVSGTMGDLIESMVKRSIGVKDSGHLIPGHGGILDRVDSLLMVIPSSLIFIFIFYIYAI